MNAPLISSVCVRLRLAVSASLHPPNLHSSATTRPMTKATRSVETGPHRCGGRGGNVFPSVARKPANDSNVGLAFSPSTSADSRKSINSFTWRPASPALTQASRSPAFNHRLRIAAGGLVWDSADNCADQVHFRPSQRGAPRRSCWKMTRATCQRMKFLEVLRTFHPKQNITIAADACGLQIESFSMNGTCFSSVTTAPGQFQMFPRDGCLGCAVRNRRNRQVRAR